MFDEKAKRNIINYKYQGGDTSPIYQHLLSPLAQWCVDTFIPRWMAPNVITALGLACSFAATALTLMFNPTLGPDAPRWLHLFTAVALFLYQTLDNMDGKQARKTGTSSALGMLFDHGCDAVNAGVSMISFSSVLGLGWGGKQFFTYFSAFILFYVHTWEEYYVGSLILPPFNGPTEGLIMAYVIGLLSFFFGSSFYHSPIFELPSSWLFHENDLLRVFGLPTAENPVFTPFNVVFLISSVGISITCMGQVIRVVMHLKKTNPDMIWRALMNLVPFIIYFPCTYLYNTYSKVALVHYPVMTSLFHGATFAEMVVHIMVGHITHTRIMSIERYSVWLFVGLVFVALYEQGAGPVETTLLFALTLFSTMSFLSYFSLVCTEFAEVLNIKVFSVGPRYPDRSVKNP